MPVVELFQSLLPGTGSAMFELIRGLYDDQNREKPVSRSLRYRGIPTYPSDAAYRLFSSFFSAQVPGGDDPFSVFMDSPRSHLVTWLPVPDPPRRHFDATNKVCVTIQGQRILKATCWDDPAGIAYQAFDQRGAAPCQRGLAVDQKRLLLMDQGSKRVIPLPDNWGTVTGPPMPVAVPTIVDWTSVFEGASPKVCSHEAFGAVLLYPDDEQEIGDLATQPFVADYLQDLIEQDRPLAARVGRAGHLLISGFDGAITTCLGGDIPRVCMVLYDHPAFAQRHAQILWNVWARAQRLGWLSQVRMRARMDEIGTESSQLYDLAYEWMPFSLYDKPDAVGLRTQQLSRRVSSGAVVFVVGPPTLADGCRAAGMQIQAITPVASLPTFRMHQSVLPRAQLKSGLMLYQLVRL